MADEGFNWGAAVATIILILLLIVWSNAIPPLTKAAADLGGTVSMMWTGLAPIMDTLKSWLASMMASGVDDAQKTLQQADTAAKVLNAQVDSATTALAATPLVKQQLQKDVANASAMIQNSDKIIADAATNRPQDLPKIQEQLKQAATIVAGAPSMMQQIDANAAAAAKVLNDAPKQAAVIDAATQKANKVIAVAKVEDAKAKAEADAKAAAAAQKKKKGTTTISQAQAKSTAAITKIAGTGAVGTAATKAVDAKLNKVNEAIKNPGKAAENYAKNMVANLNPVSADIVRVNTGKGQAADEALAIVLTAKRTMDALPPGVPMQVKLVAAGAMVVATETKRIVKLVEWQAKIPCPSGFRNDGAYCFKPAPYGRGAGYPWKFGDGLNDKGMYKRCEKANKQGCEKNGAIVYPKCKPGYFNVGCCTCSPKCPSNMKDIGISCHKPMPPPGTI
jgi:hypothetical protein